MMVLAQVGGTQYRARTARTAADYAEQLTGEILGLVSDGIGAWCFVAEDGTGHGGCDYMGAVTGDDCYSDLPIVG